MSPAHGNLLDSQTLITACASESHLLISTERDGYSADAFLTTS